MVETTRSRTIWGKSGPPLLRLSDEVLKPKHLTTGGGSGRAGLSILLTRLAFWLVLLSPSYPVFGRYCSQIVPEFYDYSYSLRSQLRLETVAAIRRGSRSP